MLDIILVLFAYLLGSICTAIPTCKLMGLPDPRSQGSRNPGATNVLRIAGKKAAAITLAGDFLKGLIPVLTARLAGADDPIIAATALAAFLGHLYPIFFGSRGGKGVATALGVLLGVVWPVALAALATWLIIAKVFNISSLAALVSAALAPLYSWAMGASSVYISITIVIAILLIWRHRSNITRLLEGSEEHIRD